MVFRGTGMPTAIILVLVALGSVLFHLLSPWWCLAPDKRRKRSRPGFEPRGGMGRRDDLHDETQGRRASSERARAFQWPLAFLARRPPFCRQRLAQKNHWQKEGPWTTGFRSP